MELDSSPFQFTIEELPQEILHQILTWLDLPNIISISATSKNLHSLTQDNNLWKILVAKHFRVPCEKLHIETTGNSLTQPLEDDWLSIMKLIKLKTIQNRFGMPEYLRRDDIDPLIRIEDDNLTATFLGLVGGNQVAFANTCFRINMKMDDIVNTLAVLQNLDNLLLPYLLLEAFYTDNTDPNSISYRIVSRYVAYYEITISSKQTPRSNILGRTPCIAIGLGTSRFPATRYMPGWLTDSYGYHSDDGHIFGSQCNEKGQGTRFGAGDTVGVGVDFKHRFIFFTKNGVAYEKVAFTNIRECELVPIIGLDTNDYVTANFGEKPFKFNFKANLEFPETSATGRGVAIFTFLRLHSSLQELKEGLEDEAEDNNTATSSLTDDSDDDIMWNDDNDSDFIIDEYDVDPSDQEQNDEEIEFSENLDN